MLNQVLIEGYVSGAPWKFDGKQYFRLGSYRDPHRPAKLNALFKESRDEPDYVTVQITPQGAPVAIPAGAKVRVGGFLQSRYVEESLGKWLKSAKGPKNSFTASSDYLNDLRHTRVITEVVAETLVVLEDPKPRQSRQEKQSAEPSKVVEPTAVPADA